MFERRSGKANREDQHGDGDFDYRAGDTAVRDGDAINACEPSATSPR